MMASERARERAVAGSRRCATSVRVGRPSHRRLLEHMPPKRKAPSKAASKKASASDEPAPASNKKSKSKEEAPPAPAKSPATAKSKPLGSRTVTELWNSPDYVENGKMTQEGFAGFIGELGIEEMSFEAIYLTFRLSPSTDVVDDVMTVCASKQSMQGALDGLG